MLSKLFCDAHLGSEGFNVLYLAFGDALEDVARPLLDERHEGTMAERTVGATKREGVGEAGNSNAEVGCYAFLSAP